MHHIIHENISLNASYLTWKYFIESLSLSKLDYRQLMFERLSKYKKQRNNKLIQTSTGFVKCKYGKVGNIAVLN